MAFINRDKNQEKSDFQKALLFPGFLAGIGYDYMGEIKEIKESEDEENENKENSEWRNVD